MLFTKCFHGDNQFHRTVTVYANKLVVFQFDDISLSICTQPASVTQPPSASEKIRMTFAGDCSFGAINGFQGPRYFPAVYQASRSISYPFDRVKSILRRMI